jgi:hypothetical protein
MTGAIQALRMAAASRPIQVIGCSIQATGRPIPAVAIAAVRGRPGRPIPAAYSLRAAAVPTVCRRSGHPITAAALAVRFRPPPWLPLVLS